MEAEQFCLVNGKLVRANPYPPGKRSSGVDYFRRQLPPLPSVTSPFPNKFYTVDSSFTLRRPRDPSPSEIVKVTVTEAVDVGWCNLSQSVKARVEDGPQYLLGKEVFLKFFDPLYINPDDLPTIGIYLFVNLCLTDLHLRYTPKRLSQSQSRQPILSMTPHLPAALNLQEKI